MFLMDRDDSMDNFGLDGFFVDHWLDRLMHMVVYMFTCNCWCSSLRVTGLLDHLRIFELAQLPKMFLFVRFEISMSEFLSDLRGKIVSVLLGQDFLMLYGLNSCVCNMSAVFSNSDMGTISSR